MYIARMQNRNSLHHTIPVGSGEWVLLNVVFWSIFIIVLVISKNFSDDDKKKWGKILGLIALMNFAVSQIWQISQCTWTVETSLPLQLCSLSQLLVGFTMFTGKQLAYEFLLCWGAGAVHEDRNRIRRESAHGHLGVTFHEKHDFRTIDQAFNLRFQIF